MTLDFKTNKLLENILKLTFIDIFSMNLIEYLKFINFELILF